MDMNIITDKMKKIWIFRGSLNYMKKWGNYIYNYFLSRFRKHTRMYYVQPGKLVDLEKFCKISMADVEMIRLSAKFRLEKDEDKRIVDILRYVHGRLTYKTDQEIWNVPEYWQKARVTYDLKIGDCEDGTILILVLARLSGISIKRIFLCAGYAMRYNEKIGHAYNTYLGNDGVEYLIDWTFYYDSKRIPARRKFHEDHRYLKRWFLGNDGGFYK